MGERATHEKIYHLTIEISVGSQRRPFLTRVRHHEADRRVSRRLLPRCRTYVRPLQWTMNYQHFLHFLLGLSCASLVFFEQPCEEPLSVHLWESRHPSYTSAGNKRQGVLVLSRQLGGWGGQNFCVSVTSPGGFAAPSELFCARTSRHQESRRCHR